MLTDGSIWEVKTNTGSGTVKITDMSGNPIQVGVAPAVPTPNPHGFPLGEMVRLPGTEVPMPKPHTQPGDWEQYLPKQLVGNGRNGLPPGWTLEAIEALAEVVARKVGRQDAGADREAVIDTLWRWAAEDADKRLVIPHMGWLIRLFETASEWPDRSQFQQLLRRQFNALGEIVMAAYDAAHKDDDQPR